jgi:uncharacterized membrane protein
MQKGRVEAFSDGVIAIIITIMVLELKVPHGADLADLQPLLPVFAGYVLSFVYVGIYWNNHHHMFQTVKSVNGPVLWANLHLLFWLSTIPFVTAWMGDNPLERTPILLYGADLLITGVAYTILAAMLVRHEGKDSVIARAMGRDVKGWASSVLYILGIASAWFMPVLGLVFYVIVACMWFIPDRRVERQLGVD